MRPRCYAVHAHAHELRLNECADVNVLTELENLIVIRVEPPDAMTTLRRRAAHRRAEPRTLPRTLETY
eukprot:gene3879-biopygen2245